MIEVAAWVVGLGVPRGSSSDTYPQSSVQIILSNHDFFFFL